MSSLLQLSALKPGQGGVIQEVHLPAETALRFLEMGLAPGEPVQMVRAAPWGDPVEVEVMGVRLGIRLSDAAAITVRL